ncbi:GATA transcription factor 16 [Citrus sinensis]|nr:GATA transcription factor 16-like isoform X1 [Citrus sinensis]XP_024045164.1 GATA transcription factor 16 isoform X1 [Citrus x clementina]KAH9730663.1 GATA transcription factor 16 [Citrus sinensis]
MIKSPFALKKQRREAEEMMKSPPAGTFNEMNKSCIDCHTTRTPLWRGGPAGPRSLCNACGIRYRKTKKLALLGRDKGRAQKRKRKYSSNNNNKGATKLGISLKAGLMAVGSDMGEEEQAAILLMSLSYGCLYA